MRVLVTGASGMLGKDVVASFSQAVEKFEVYALYRNKVDIFNSSINIANIDLTEADLFGKYLNLIKPDIIIHCAAIVDVDFCEKERENAYNLHCRVIQSIASYSPNSILVYISTDSVFDGLAENYDESAIPNPINYYAESKYLGELKTIELFPKNSIIIRTNIYGYHLQNKNSLAEWALNSFKHGKQVTGFNNVFFNPVYTVQLADMILRLVQIKYKGIINVGSDAIITKYSFLVELAKTFGFNQEIVLEASLDETKFKAKRPLNTTLNLDILRDVIGDAPKMTDGLKLFYNNFTKKKNTCL